MPSLIKSKLSSSEEVNLFKQYESYVQSAEKISERRDKANGFFWAIEAGLIALLQYFEASWFAVVIAIFAILFSCYWHYLVKSYKQLNSGKYAVIHELEKRMPARAYTYEWEILDNGSNKKKYWQTTNIENIVAKTFFIFWIVACVFLICSKINESYSIRLDVQHRVVSEPSTFNVSQYQIKHLSF